MRTLILSIVCVFTLNKLIAQESNLAFLDSKAIESKNIQINNYETYLVSPNSEYLEKRRAKKSSNIISEWQHRLANYDIKINSVFDDSEKANYHITFKNKQVNIIAIYNNRSEILSTSETYRNIKLPYELMAKISKAYPNYSFLTNTYHTTYSSKTGFNKQCYRVQIRNGNQKRTLKFDNTFMTIQKT